MSNRKTTLFYALLIAIASLAVGMVIASRLDLTPQSAAQTVAAPPFNSAPINGAISATTFRDVAKAVTPAVVNIRTESRQRTQDLSQFFGGGGDQGDSDDLLQRFFGQGQGGQGQQQRQRPREQVVQAAGTGFIIDKAGFILTNNHVVEGATKIEVSLYGEDSDQEYAAKVIGRDPLTDSALIELTEKPNHPLPEIKFGDSSQMQPGDWVMAIGNPFNLAHTVSVGVISALERPFPTTEGRSTQVLQTDAAINPGNSGGPLLNIRGEVIGINSAIYTDARQAGNIGIGFAIPANMAKNVMEQLRTKGKVTRAQLGVTVQQVTSDLAESMGLKHAGGAIVSSVTAGSAAEKAGIKRGDVIESFNGQQVHDFNSLRNRVADAGPGSTADVMVTRDGGEKHLSVKLDEATASKATRERDSEPSASDDKTSLGVAVAPLTPELAERAHASKDARGLVVEDVNPNGRAADAGIQAGDVIQEVNRQAVKSVDDLKAALKKSSERPTLLLIQRNGSDIFVTVKPANG
jgi:serine protease Do